MRQRPDFCAKSRLQPMRVAGTRRNRWKRDSLHFLAFLRVCHSSEHISQSRINASSCSLGWRLGAWRAPPPAISYGFEERSPTAVPNRTGGSRGRARRVLCLMRCRCSSDQARLRSLSLPGTKWVHHGWAFYVSCTRGKLHTLSNKSAPSICRWLDESRTEIYTDWLCWSPCLAPTSTVCAPSRSELAELSGGVWSNYQGRSLAASRPVVPG